MLKILSSMLLLSKGHVSSVPVYDSAAKTVGGMIDMLDIVSFLVGIFPSCEQFLENGSKALMRERVRSILNASNHVTSLSVQNHVKLFDIIDLFAEGFHRLAIVDDHHLPLKILSQSAVNSFFLAHCHKFADILNDSIQELNLWTKSPICVSYDSKTIDVLKVIHKSKRTGVAITEKNIPVANFSASDLKDLTPESFSRLSENVLDFLRSNNNGVLKPIQTISEQGTLLEVMEILDRGKIHRVWVVGKEGNVVGVITLTDLIERLAKLDFHTSYIA